MDDDGVEWFVGDDGFGGGLAFIVFGESEFGGRGVLGTAVVDEDGGDGSGFLVYFGV